MSDIIIEWGLDALAIAAAAASLACIIVGVLFWDDIREYFFDGSR